MHADHLGTPQKMTDGAGAIVWDRQQRPFGETHSTTGTATNPQRFPGQYADASTGLHYNYFRHYDPSLGRYITSDPIGLQGGINTYTYVGGNPVNAIDPDGLESIIGPFAGSNPDQASMGELVFATGLTLFPPAVLLAPAAARLYARFCLRRSGIVYLRTNPYTGKKYVG